MNRQGVAAEPGHRNEKVNTICMCVLNRGGLGVCSLVDAR